MTQKQRALRGRRRWRCREKTPTGTADELVLGTLAAVDEDGVATGKLECSARDIALGSGAPG